MIDAEGTILANRDGLKVAVIVNDISEVNVDAQLMKNGSASLSPRRRAARQDAERTIC